MIGRCADAGELPEIITISKAENEVFNGRYHKVISDEVPELYGKLMREAIKGAITDTILMVWTKVDDPKKVIYKFADTSPEDCIWVIDDFNDDKEEVDDPYYFNEMGNIFPPLNEWIIGITPKPPSNLKITY